MCRRCGVPILYPCSGLGWGNEIRKEKKRWGSDVPVLHLHRVCHRTETHPRVGSHIHAASECVVRLRKMNMGDAPVALTSSTGVFAWVTEK